MTTETETSRRSAAARLSAEFLVIVAGVLIALAVDAAWDRFQDRQVEEASLESLAIDLDEAEKRLADSARRDSVIIARADALLAFSAVPADTFFFLFTGLFDTTPVEVRLRTYDELLNTGRLQLLRNRELRLTLTEFDAAARTLSSYSSQVEAQWNEIARPVLYRSVDWDGIAARIPEDFGQPGPDFVAPNPNESFTMNPELRSAVRDRRAFAKVHRDWFSAPVVEVLRRLRTLVDGLRRWPTPPNR